MLSLPCKDNLKTLSMEPDSNWRGLSSSDLQSDAFNHSAIHADIYEALASELVLVVTILANELGLVVTLASELGFVWWGRMDSNHRVFWSLVYSQVQSASLPHPQVRALGSDLVRVCWNSRQQSLIEKKRARAL